MQDNFAPDGDRPTVVSAKLPADIVAIIDHYATRQLLNRAAWIRKAIVAQLDADIDAATMRPDIYGLAEVLG